MMQTCPNPACGQSYPITPDLIGRRMSCGKCGTAFVISGGGSAGPPPLPQAADPSTGAGPASRSGFPLPLPGWLPDVPTILFGAGTFLVILYVFLPQINQANVAGREARIVANNLRFKRSEEVFKAKKEPAADDKERFEQTKEKYEKRKRELEEAAEDAEEWRRRATWWHRWGMMFGLLLLCAGSLGFLNPSQPPMRRLIGAVVLLALLVTVVMTFVGFGVEFRMGPR